MGWQGTRMLTNGEHDELWRNVFQNNIPNIDIRLGHLLLLNSLKELYDNGIISKEAYAQSIVSLLTKAKVCNTIPDEDFTEEGLKLLDKK